MTRPAFRPAFYPAFRPAFNKLKSVAAAVRSVYNFDGVDDRGQLAFRAINPDGDIDIEWEQAFLESNNTANGVIVSQCGSGVNSTQEFRLTFLGVSSALEMIIGGSTYPILTQAQGAVRSSV